MVPVDLPRQLGPRESPNGQKLRRRGLAHGRTGQRGGRGDGTHTGLLRGRPTPVRCCVHRNLNTMDMILGEGEEMLKVKVLPWGRVRHREGGRHLTHTL